MSSEYTRTRIVRMKVSGYRSLYDVELDDVADTVVLLGKNGAGKSNLMRVPGLALQWAARLAIFGDSFRVTHVDASEDLGLRPTDFSNGRPPNLRVELELELGLAAGLVVRRSAEALGRLRAVVLAQDFGRNIEFSLAELTLDGTDLTGGPKSRSAEVDRLLEELGTGRFLLHCQAYRRLSQEPMSAGSDDPSDLARSFQRRMLAAHVDPDIGRRRQLKRLGERLAEIGAFDVSEGIELSPVQDAVFKEYRLYVSLPGVGDVPLENLGTGQQQLIMMAADALVERRPIVMIEEPEAHLHASLMESFAKFLRLEVEQAGQGSPIDQVWISTHHHAFAIAPEYYEVEYDAERGTTVHRCDRALAARHFYEPGPLWEALRALASSTTRETVVMHDGDGHPVTAGAILDSIEGNRELANAFADAATKAIVTRFRKRPVEAS